MIHVQKHFPPERLRYMRKVMGDTHLKAMGWNIDQLERACRQAEFDRWKLSQERERWIYNVTTLRWLKID